MLIQKEFFKKWGYKVLDQALIKAPAASREKCASFLGLGLSQLLLSHCESRGDAGIRAGFPLTPSTSSSMLWAMLPGACTARSPRAPYCPHDALGYGAQAECRQEALLLGSKNQSTQAEEMLCYNLICSWLDATLSTNCFILKHL